MQNSVYTVYGNAMGIQEMWLSISVGQKSDKTVLSCSEAEKKQHLLGFFPLTDHSHVELVWLRLVRHSVNWYSEIDLMFKCWFNQRRMQVVQGQAGYSVLL